MFFLSSPKTCLFFYSILITCSLITLPANLQNRDSLTGTWTYIEEDINVYSPTGDYIPSSWQRKRKPLCKELKINKIGKHDPYYHVIPDNGKGLVFKILNDSTLYEKNGSDTTLLLYNPRDHTLQFSAEKNNFIGVVELYFPKFNRTAYDELSQAPLMTENFFDFDISNYQSGNINNFVPGRRVLPFRISRSFISKRGIRDLTIDIRLVEPRYKTYDTSGCKARLVFDTKGYVQKVSCIFPDGEEHWNFTRRNDLDHSLLKIDFSSSDANRQKANRTYYYDVDEWPVDDDGVKIVDQPGEWKMLDSYVPLRFSLPRSGGFVEFKYDETHHLTEMVLFEKQEKRGTISFVYNKDGVLTNVNWTVK